MDVKVTDLRTDEQVAADKYVNVQNGKPTRFTKFSELAAYGVVIDRSKGWDAAPVGAPVWVLTGFTIRPGMNVIDVNVKMLDGSNALNGQVRVAHTWEGAPSFGSDQLHPDFSYNKSNTGVAGWTKDNGTCGFPIQEYIPAEGSKFREWIMTPLDGSPPQHTDMVQGCGQFGGTNHTCISPNYQLMYKTDDGGGGNGGGGNGGGTPPPDGPLVLVLMGKGKELCKVSIDDKTILTDLELYLMTKLGDWSIQL